MIQGFHTGTIPMLTPAQISETYFLESRHQLLEIAAYLDRYDAAVARDGGQSGPADAEKKLALIRQALAIVAETKPTQERTVALLELFARV
jgi:hypothetical protein